MRKHALRALIIIGILAILLAVAMTVYGSALNRAVGAITYQSPVLSYRYPGVYEGSARVMHVASSVRVTMTPTGIASIDLLQQQAGDMHTLVARIIKAGGVPVDVITGATASSRVLMKAVDDALMKQRP
jgi:uncharacterized protein with FMN-binding domain